MVLFKENEAGQAVFFSPSRITAIRAQQKDAEDQKEAERLRKEEEKEFKAKGKERKAQEVQERKETRQKMLAEKREQKQHEKETRMLQRQANQQLRYEQNIAKNDWMNAAKSKKRKAFEDPSSMPPPSKSRLSHTGRRIALPARFHS